MPKKVRKSNLGGIKVAWKRAKPTPEDEIKALKAEIEKKNEEIEDLKKASDPKTSTQTTKTLIQSTQTSYSHPKPPKTQTYEHTIWNDGIIKWIITQVLTDDDSRHFFSLSLGTDVGTQSLLQKSKASLI